MPFTVPNASLASYPSQASLDSGDLAILAAGPGQTGVASGCAVTAQGTPNMTVAVAAGVVRIAGRRVIVAGGNVTITAANATNPRHDLITVDTAGALAVVTGTPAAVTSTSEPTFAAIPASRVVLASVYVPAADAAIDSTQITDKRVTITDSVYEDPRWYGAVGNDSTDDTAAVQAAITAALAGNRRVFIPPLTFSVGALTLAASNVTIFGSGWASKLHLRSGTNAYALTITNTDTSQTVSGVRLADFTIDANGGSQTAGGGVNLVFGTRCVFDHLQITTPWHAGIMHTASSGGGWPFENTFIGCLFTLGQNSADAANSGYAIDFVDAEESTVTGCSFEFNGAAHVKENVVGNNSIIGNHFVNGQTGIYSNGSRGRWIGNVFDSLAGHCFRVIGNENMISNNAAFLIGQGGTAGQASAVALDWQSSRNIITGNRFSSHGTTGQTRSFIYEMFNNTTGNQIKDNVFVVAGTLAQGVVEKSGTSNVYRGNSGLNPVGSVTAPAVPATTVAATNTTGYDCTVYVTGGTVQSVSVGGVTTGLTSGAFRVPANQTITLAYTVAPTWKWFAD